ncbi:hypothetical protein ILYODFUR_036648 [Ilyodon furcidens]|uniref:Secreted protein n=1 Tax=Ilyodon furcidens TaxID=33524 RepID=A0ABV0T6I3_9TELE
MAAAVGRLALWLTCRVPVDRDIARTVTAPYLCWRRHRERRPAVTTRQYSSDSKDDLTVRYLDGEDAVGRQETGERERKDIRQRSPDLGLEPWTAASKTVASIHGSCAQPL